jgi:acetylornithine deacetylase/succinyl-diaminopimelate desuccinylase-like protein
MKGIAAMHAVAATSLARSESTPAREVLVVAVADEEAGGKQGASWILDEHAERVGFGDGRPAPEVLGEGAYGLSGVLDRPVLPVALGEKSALWVNVRAKGEPGHGSMPPDRQAPRNLASFLAKVSGYGTPRIHDVMRAQMRALAGASSGGQAAAFRALASPLGNVMARALAKQLRSRSKAVAAALSDTITTTQINAGYKHNVVPGHAEAALDCRVLPDTRPDAFISDLAKVGARYEVEVELLASHGGPVSEPGPLYSHIETISRSVAPDAVIVPTITPAITDVRYWRARGATGYGWVPLVLTPELLGTIHGHDERVPVGDFERAVKAMTDLVARAAT